VQFFHSRAAFEHERAMYMDRDLHAALPPVTEMRSNEHRAIVGARGFVFPPFIVTDHGESLDTWIRKRSDPGFAATVRVLRDIAGQLKGLHAQNLVHRNLNPESILWRPKHHTWSLADFGCADRAGARRLPAHRASASQPVLSHDNHMCTRPTVDDVPGAESSAGRLQGQLRAPPCLAGLACCAD
jgi:Protein tyrosine and serine/threonine kinase